MSYLVNKKEKGKRGQVIDEWIKLNHPDNGLFRVYWKNVIASNIGDVTLDPNDGEELRYEWYYKDGKRADGISKGWWPNGKLKHKWCWKNNLRDGLWIFYDENGQKKSEEIYKDGKKDGLWTHWYENGQKSIEETYKDGEMDGLWTDWYEWGQKKEEVTYKYGEKDGKWTWWDENGQKESVETYKDGVKDGLGIYWYDNGQKQAEGTFNNGKEDGLWTYWSSDGNDFAKLIIKNGQPWDGTYKKWSPYPYPNGKKILERFYKDGIVKWEKKWRLRKEGTSRYFRERV